MRCNTRGRTKGRVQSIPGFMRQVPRQFGRECPGVRLRSQSRRWWADRAGREAQYSAPSTPASRATVMSWRWPGAVSLVQTGNPSGRAGRLARVRRSRGVSRVPGVDRFAFTLRVVAAARSVRNSFPASPSRSATRTAASVISALLRVAGRPTPDFSVPTGCASAWSARASATPTPSRGRHGSAIFDAPSDRTR